MKLPKSKTGLFVVCRHEMAADEGVPIGIFVTHESAEDYANKCEGELNDKGITVFHFRTHYVMFYNE